jgi:opacity protein-like surface antigen
MNRARTFFAGVMGVFAFVASAHAADPARSWPRSQPQPQPQEEPEAPTQYRQLMSGWYLRGDIAYRWNSGGTPTSNVTSEKYTTSYDATFGFGYKYQWFRADLTFDYAGPARVTANTTAATPQPQFTAKIGSQTVLANGYIDFGTWAGFTPYVGAGVGIARLRSVNFVDTADSPSTISTGPGFHQNFAWAAMAGVAYQVTQSWLIDVGYRHLELGNVPGSNAAGALNAVTFKSQSSNEARIGFRYLFD